MSLTSSRTPHPSQLAPSPYRFTLTPVVAIRANRANRSPRLLAYFLRLLSSRQPHSRPGGQRQGPWPHSTAFWPHPVLPLPPVAQVCSVNGAGLYGGWRRLDFIIQTGANRKRISPKRGAGMYNIFKPLPLAWQTCTTYTANLHRSHYKPAPTILQTCPNHMTNLRRWRSSWRRSRKKRKRNAEKSKKVAFNLKRNRPQTCAKHRKCRLSVSFLTKRISIPSFAKRETIPG